MQRTARYMATTISKAGRRIVWTTFGPASGIAQSHSLLSPIRAMVCSCAGSAGTVQGCGGVRFTNINARSLIFGAT